MLTNAVSLSTSLTVVVVSVTTTVVILNFGKRMLQYPKHPLNIAALLLCCHNLADDQHRVQ